MIVVNVAFAQPAAFTEWNVCNSFVQPIGGANDTVTAPNCWFKIQKGNKQKVS